jgi:hypothetical protein
MEDEKLGVDYELWLDEIESTLEPINEEDLWRELNLSNKFMLVLED